MTTLAGFTAAAGFALADTAPLTVAGAVAGGTAAALTDTNALTVTGSVTGSTVSLTGSSLTLPGLVSDGGAGTTSLTASAGTIGATGTLIVGTLSGSSAAPA